MIVASDDLFSGTTRSSRLATAGRVAEQAAVLAQVANALCDAGEMVDAVAYQLPKRLAHSVTLNIIIFEYSNIPRL
jgi:hypothetical protein